MCHAGTAWHPRFSGGLKVFVPTPAALTAAQARAKAISEKHTSGVGAALDHGSSSSSSSSSGSSSSSSSSNRSGGGGGGSSFSSSGSGNHGETMSTTNAATNEGTGSGADASQIEGSPKDDTNEVVFTGDTVPLRPLEVHWNPIPNGGFGEDKM